MKYLLFIISSAVIAFVFLSNTQNLIAPGTKIGNKDLSYMKVEEVASLIKKARTSPLYFNLTNESISKRSEEIGIALDETRLNQLTTKCVLGRFCAKTNDRSAADSLVSINNSLLEKFILEIENQIGKSRSKAVINFEDSSFYSEADKEEIKIDRAVIKKEVIAEKLLLGEPLELNLLKSKTADAVERNKNTKALISKAVSEPLLLKYGRQPVKLPKEKLETIIASEIKDGLLIAKTDPQRITEILDEISKEYDLAITLDKEHAIKAIEYALLFRVGEEKLNEAVILPFIGNPKTNGEVASKYIEINKTQQRLYRFENNKLVKTYVVGTGLTWETPSGNFKILRKNRMSYSYFGGWYLPYMMPIGQINGYNFGIHEIPYHKDSNGNIYSRDENTMGSPATGGCIQMYKEDVREIYDWVTVGTPVVITD